MTLWEIDIYPKTDFPNRLAEEVIANASDIGLSGNLEVNAARSYLLQGELNREQVEKIATTILADSVVEDVFFAEVGDESLSLPPAGNSNRPNLLHVMPKPGVTDSVAENTQRILCELEFPVEAASTMSKYWLSEVDDSTRAVLTERVLANDSIEQVIDGPLKLEKLQLGNQYDFKLNMVGILSADDEKLSQISKDWQLSLTLVEMQTIQTHFKSLDRDPTDIELETIAQTWSEHCSHKTLAGRIRYTDENGERNFENMLKETIFAATQKIRKDLGDQDWCVSVFKDNAGIVKFDEQFNVAFKVETHNRPSAIEPYGGANTGIGGVIRDTLGTGLGAKPICNTDVFCFADPNTPTQDLPAGVLHPKRILNGVVSGVRDYGNRMGIPTVNGAIYFDERYVGNPLVFCGNVGLLPKEKSFKEPLPNDLIVSIGGRTGRDGIHGATFSSAELSSESEKESGGAVQIGNAITEKMAMDVLLKARDQNLYSAVTDCGAGGFSSAVGEMGEEIGAEVWLEKAPLKYSGLSYTEIWISEAQERMVFAVPEENWEAFNEICKAESVEATVIGRYVPTGNLTLKYNDEVVGELSMKFIHDGRPPVVREAIYESQPESNSTIDISAKGDNFLGDSLDQILSMPNIASKEWVIRQYDHEVQGGSVIKPLVGVNNDGPGDAAVVRPLLDSRRGLAISCGMNPNYGDIDPYWMAASGIDEAIRNCVAVGADPSRIALLDNFCWGYTDRPETLGSLVRAAIACYDLSTVLQTPFISGKDSLNNEFRYQDDAGNEQRIKIPSTLLISAMGQVDSVDRCVTMDWKTPGNLIYQVGLTRNEMGGSHFNLLNEISGGSVPKVDVESAKVLFAKMHSAIKDGLVRSCHDLSEGGLAVALAEMAFAGGWGGLIDVSCVPVCEHVAAEDRMVASLFSESNTRFVCEIEPQNQEAFESNFADLPLGFIGQVTDQNHLTIFDGEPTNEVLSEDIDSLKYAWQKTLQF